MFIAGVRGPCEATFHFAFQFRFPNELAQARASNFSMPRAQRALQHGVIVGHGFFPRQGFGSPWAGLVDANPYVIK